MKNLERQEFQPSSSADEGELAAIGSKPEAPKFLARGHLWFWGSLVLVLFSGVDFFFALLGIPFGFECIGIPGLADSAKGHVVGAIGGWLAGGIALATFYISFYHKQFLQEQQLHQANKIAFEQRRQERQQAEYDGIAKEFSELCDDFAHPHSLGRINAAINLVRIGSTPDPRLKKTPEHEVFLTTKNYPWYQAVARQLAAALAFYEEPQERAEVRNAIRGLAKFVSFEQEDWQPMLTFLIERIAEANRSAKTRLYDVLAEGAACGDPMLLRTFSRFVTPHRSSRVCVQHLRSIGREPEFLAKFKSWSARRQCMGFAYGQPCAEFELRQVGQQLRTGRLFGVPDEAFLNRLSIASGMLIDTRDAFADCVRPEIRTSPASFAEQFIGQTFLELDQKKIATVKASETWFPCIELNQANLVRVDLGCSYLSYANMWNSKLMGAILQCAKLEYANLTEALVCSSNLRWTDFSGASLSLGAFGSADLLQANLSKAVLHATDFESSLLVGANLKGVDARDANLKDAILRTANLEGTWLWKADLSDADLSDANLLDAKMAGSILSTANQWGHTGTKFDRTNWQTADWNFWEYDPKSKELIRTNRRDSENWSLVRLLVKDYQSDENSQDQG